MRATESQVPSSLPRVAVARLIGHDGPVQAVLFTVDGRYCITGGVDRTVRLWNPSRLDPACPPMIADPIKNRHHSRRMEFGKDVPAEHLPPALPIQTYEDGITYPVTAIAVDTASNILVAASDKTLVVTDVLTKRAQRRLQGHVARINAVAISDGSETFLSASYDASVRIWDGRSHSPDPIQVLKEAKDSVTSLHVVQSSDQALIRSASVDGKVRTYDLRKGVIRCDDFGNPIIGMAPTSDGQCLVVSCLDGTIRLMDVDSGQLLNTFAGRHVAGQYGLACCVTADDNTVVTGSEDGQLVLYDIVRACPVQTLMGHTRPTCAVATHPKEASVMVSASYDSHAIVWANNSDYMSSS